MSLPAGRVLLVAVSSAVVKLPLLATGASLTAVTVMVMVAGLVVTVPSETV